MTEDDNSNRVLYSFLAAVGIPLLILILALASLHVCTRKKKEQKVPETVEPDKVVF